MTAFGKPPKQDDEEETIGWHVVWFSDRDTQTNRYMPPQSKTVRVVLARSSMPRLCDHPNCGTRVPLTIKIRYPQLLYSLEEWKYCDMHGGRAKMEMKLLEFLHDHDGRPTVDPLQVLRKTGEVHEHEREDPLPAPAASVPGDSGSPRQVPGELLDGSGRGGRERG